MNWNITDTINLEKYSEKILKMYESSYKHIGLIDFGGWDGLKNYLNCSCYLLEDKEKEIHGVILYWLSEYGNKISLVISETAEIGKTYVIPKVIELLQTPGFYVELSDALEYLVRKSGLDNIKDKNTIKMLIPKLKDEDIFNKDDERSKIHPLNALKGIPSPEGSFMRFIKDIGIHRKALYGLPSLQKTFIGDKCDRKCESRGGKKNRTKHKKNRTKHKKRRTKHKKRGTINGRFK
jgi:hypothetical protein